MDRRTLDRLPGLVELRNYLQSVAGLNTIAQGHAELKGEYTNMLGIDDVYSPEVASKCMVELDQSIAVTAQLAASTQHMLDRVTSEINTMAAELTTKDYFINHLRIDDQSRTSWRINTAATNAVIVECSDPHLWKYPACCINAQHTDLVDVLRPADCLYLVDYNPSILKQHLDSAGNLRLKFQNLEDFNATLDFDKYISRVAQNTRWGVPKGQMAIVLCWHLFERLTLECMETQMLVIKELLRPGGKFIFNVNNADNIAGARMVSLNSCSYATKPLIEDLCNRAGLELDKWEPIIGSTTALVSVRLPGQLSSAKFQPGRGIIKKS